MVFLWHGNLEDGILLSLGALSIPGAADMC